MRTIIFSLSIILFFCLNNVGAIAQTTKTVGSGGDYTTLNAAIADIQNGNLNGDIILNIISDITETNASIIEKSGVANWNYSSITIRPSGDARKINAGLTEPILCVAGSNIVIVGIVDGIGSSNQLTFSNSSGPAINIINYYGVENIALKYLNLEGVAESITAGIVNVLSHASTATTGIVIENCKIGNPNGNAANGIYAKAFSSGDIGVTVQNCEIANVWHSGISSKGISINEGCEAWTITSNSFYQTSTRTATVGNTHYGIYINGGEDHTISNNYIGGSEPLCAGTAWTIAGEYANKFVGIYLNVGTTYPANLENNNIHNFNHTYHSTSHATSLPGIWCGIYLGGGDADFSDNIIGSNTEANSIIVNSTGTSNVASYGIGINSAVSTADVNNNYIGSFTLNSSSNNNGHSFIGIHVAAAGDITIGNNTIGHQTIPNFIISTNPNESTGNEQNVRGIVKSANINTNISNNNIVNLSNSTIGKGDVVGIFCDKGVNKIVGNSISMLTNSSEYKGEYSGYNPVVGILLESNLEEQLVNSNTIHHLLNTYGGGPYDKIRVNGIILSGNGSGTISQNLIYDISISPSSSNYGIANGIWLRGGKAVVMNNAIRLGFGDTSNTAFVGIQVWSGNNSILGNSVYIGGTEMLNYSTYAFRKSGGETDKVYNNIFYNVREHATDYSEHYAIGKHKYLSLESDYNNLYSLKASTVANDNVGENGYYWTSGGQSLEQWQAATGCDANSLSADPLFVGADGAIPNMHITASSPMINMGTSVYPLVVDIDDDIRDQLPDIGCDEFYTGSVVIGEGQAYTTLKQVFDAINNGTITGNISINLQSSTTETATAMLYESGYNGTSDYTSVSIGTVTENITVSGNIAAPIVSFNGAHNVNMVDLTIENGNTDGYCVEFTNSANNNRITGCNLVGNTQLSNKGLITFDAAGPGTGNNNNIIENCTFGNGTSSYRYGVVSTGTTGVGNNDNTITESKIYNFWSNGNASAGIYLDENNSNWDIAENHLYQTGAITATGGNAHFGIQSLSTNNINITNNYIGGSGEECGGAAWTVSGAFANSFTGISISGENTGESTVSGNTISNFSWTAAPDSNMYDGAGIWTAIAYGGGIIDITENTIGAPTGTNNIVIETTSGYHVASYGIKGGIDGANITISGNTIGSIDVSTGSVDYSHLFTGIQNDGATEITISNNLIGSENTAKSINASTECTHNATGQHLIGIVNNANTTTCNIRNNTVKNLHNSTLGSWSSQSGSPHGHMVIGIAVTNGANLMEGNTISNLTTTSSDSRVDQVIGIYASSNKQGQEIIGNSMFNLKTDATDRYTKLSGIRYISPETGNNRVMGNRIYKIFSSGSGAGTASDIAGISFGGGKTTDYYNNMISLGSDVTAGHNIYGIRSVAVAKGNFYYNSIVISGSVTTGSLNGGSFAFNLNWTSPEIVVMNNIFVNTRTNSSHNNNYAFYLGNPNDANLMTLDYNAYWANGTGTVLAYNGIADKTELPILAGKDENSINSEVIFTNIATADLHTNTADVNAAATPISGITIDFDGNTRNPLFPDIGADEFVKPIINNPGISLNFGWTDVLTPTAPKSYQLVGIDLSNNMVVTAPANFQVSLSSDEGFAQSISIPRTNSNVDTTIYARYLPDVENTGAYGDITNASSGQQVTVHVEGSARAIPPVMETGSVSHLTPDTVKINAEIVHTGGRNVLSRGIIYWPYDGEDKEIGDQNVINIGETGSFEKGEFSLTIEDLDINTHYNYRSYANNGNSGGFGGTGYGETLDFWTLAKTPNVPVVDEITASTVRIELTEDDNPAYTEYAIYETTTGRYIQDDGSMNTSPVWNTSMEWGKKTVSLYAYLGLTGNRQYTFKVMATNGAGTQSAFSETISILTLANTPNIMWVGNSTTTTLEVSVYTSPNDYSGNTEETLYAIEETTTGKFLQTNGTLATDTVWNTRNNWNAKTVTDLNNATEYNFRSIATNNDEKRTLPGPAKSLFTLAVIPEAPALSGVTTNTAQISINPATNPSNVEFAIYMVNERLFVQSNGELGNSPIWQTKALWGETIIQGLSPNNNYSISVGARNGNNVETARGEQTSITTLANIPLPPDLYVYSYTDKLRCYVVLSGNPQNTEFAIQDSISGKYLQPNGYLSETPEWKTRNGWQAATQEILGLQPGTEYAIRVKARNSIGIETDWGIAKKLSTYPNIPGSPILSNITVNSIDLGIGPNNNPDNVTYAIHEENSDKFVQPNGTLGDLKVWQTLTNWGTITINNLDPDQKLTLAIAAQNNDKAETNYSEKASTFTLAETPKAPTVEATSSTSIALTINPNGNPTSVRYAVYESNMGKYLDYNNQYSVDPVWFSFESGAEFEIGYLLPSTEYTFKVKARNTEWIETGFSPEASVTTPDGPPIAPTLVSPENGSTGHTNSILFNWNEITNADTYNIQIATHSGFYENTIVFETSDIAETEIEVDSLLFGTTMYWRISASNEHGTGEWSNTWSFTTKDGPPVAPILLSPEDGKTEIPLNTNLAWYLPENTDGFNLQVSTVPDFSALVIDTTYNLASWNSPYYCYIHNLSSYTTYYWRVSARNEHGTGLWSEVRSFTTMDVTLDVPELISPANGAENISNNVSLIWKWDGPSVSFDVQVAKDENFENLLTNQNNYHSTEYFLYGLEDNTKYYWRVRSSNEWSQSEWSDTWWFKTHNGLSVPSEIFVDINIFPNPVGNTLYIAGNDVDRISKVSIFTNLGSLIFETQMVDGTINTIGLKPGIYILKMETAKGIVIKRFIKQ
jgi:hypothetical protein